MWAFVRIGIWLVYKSNCITQNANTNEKRTQQHIHRCIQWIAFGKWCFPFFSVSLSALFAFGITQFNKELVTKRLNAAFQINFFLSYICCYGWLAKASKTKVFDTTQSNLILFYEWMHSVLLLCCLAVSTPHFSIGIDWTRKS